MHDLLSLPRELRDRIIESVLDLPTPTFKTALGNRSNNSIHLIRLETPPKYPTTACALELVNRHLWAETRSAVKRISSELPNYSLDVIIASGFDEIWPTWTCVPKLSERIDRVDVRVRLFDTNRTASASNADLRKIYLEFPYRPDGALTGRQLLIRQDDRPSRILATAFYWMLKHFLDHGPSSEKSPAFRHVSVKEIHLNFFESENGQNFEERSAAAIEESIMEYLRLLLIMDNATACYGSILFERVGAITSSVEGELTTKIDLGDWLYKKGQDPESHLSELFPDAGKLKNWVNRAARKRERLGFPSRFHLAADVRSSPAPPAPPHTQTSIPRTPVDTDMEGPPYCRDEVVVGLTSYYKFLAGLHIPESAVLYPPPGGWPTITRENFAPYGKTDVVIDLLRHIPYVQEQPRYDEQYDIYEGCCAVDYRNPEFTGERGHGNFHAAEFPLNETTDDQEHPPPHVIVLGNLSRGRNGHFFMVDTGEGTATMNDWQCGDGPWYPIKGFFERLKDRYRSMILRPEKGSYVR